MSRGNAAGISEQSKAAPRCGIKIISTRFNAARRAIYEPIKISDDGTRRSKQQPPFLYPSCDTLSRGRLTRTTCPMNPSLGRGCCDATRIYIYIYMRWWWSEPVRESSNRKSAKSDVISDRMSDDLWRCSATIERSRAWAAAGLARMLNIGLNRVIRSQDTRLCELHSWNVLGFLPFDLQINLWVRDWFFPRGWDGIRRATANGERYVEGNYSKNTKLLDKTQSYAN